MRHLTTRIVTVCVVAALASVATPVWAQPQAAPSGRSLYTMYALLAGGPTPGTGGTATALILPGTVVLTEPDLQRYSADLSRLQGQLKSTYNLGSLDPIANTALNLVPNREETMPTTLASLGVSVTLLDFDEQVASYHIRLTDHGKVLAEPQVSVKIGSRAVIGTRDGPEAPYAFIVLSVPPLSTLTTLRDARVQNDAVTLPRLVSQVRPRYSEMAARIHAEGTVVVKCIVGLVGVPRNFRVVSPSNDLFDQSALDAVRQYRFEPARDSTGKAVEYEVTVECTFTWR
jgi:TonB family protein